MEVWMTALNKHRYLLLSFCFDWEDISNTLCFIDYKITSNFVKNIPLRVLFSTLRSWCLNIPMKNCLSRMIYHIYCKINLVQNKVTILFIVGLIHNEIFPVLSLLFCFCELWSMG